MKDLITDAIRSRLGSTLEAIGGADALFGETRIIDGEEVIPVARLSIRLDASAEGGGSGAATLPLPGGKRTRGGGDGTAAAGIHITVEPVGLVRKKGDALVLDKLTD